MITRCRAANDALHRRFPHLPPVQPPSPFHHYFLSSFPILPTVSRFNNMYFFFFFFPANFFIIHSISHRRGRFAPPPRLPAACTFSSPPFSFLSYFYFIFVALTLVSPSVLRAESTYFVTFSDRNKTKKKKKERKKEAGTNSAPVLGA